MEFMKIGLVDKRMNEWMNEEENQNKRTKNNRHRMQIFKDGNGLVVPLRKHKKWDENNKFYFKSHINICKSLALLESKPFSLFTLAKRSSLYSNG